MGNPPSSLILKDDPKFIYECYQIIEEALIIHKHRKLDEKSIYTDMIEISKHVNKIIIQDVHGVDIIEFKKTNKVWGSKFLHKPV